jgi:hypothetical protein
MAPINNQGNEKHETVNPQPGIQGISDARIAGKLTAGAVPALFGRALSPSGRFAANRPRRLVLAQLPR